MIWPFKKKEPALSVEEWAKQFPPAPCGNQAQHYEWEKINGFKCPNCYAERERKRKDAELQALADKIVAGLRAHGVAFPATSQPEPCPRGADKPEKSCTNRHQCWEPCGQLGNDERHVRFGREELGKAPRGVPGTTNDQPNGGA